MAEEGAPRHPSIEGAGDVGQTLVGVAGVVAQHGFLIVRYPRTPTAFGRASTGAATIPAMGDGLLR
jgi:hypothetical protein